MVAIDPDLLDVFPDGPSVNEELRALAPIIRRRRAALVLALALAPALSAPAQDWPQWRGPTRDGVVPAPLAPAAWPEGLLPAWRVEVGEGYSSPVVAGGRAFVHGRRDPDEVVVAVDLATGKVLWEQSYPAQFGKNPYAVEMAKGPHATPLVAGERLFTVGVTGIVTAWDAATGRRLWRRDFSDRIDTSKLFCGTAASPLADGGLVVVQVGSDVHGGEVLGLDPATGETRWTWRGPGPGYASPVAIEVGGQRQLVTLTNGSIVGLDAATGTELWSVPFPDEWHENIATPVWTGSLLIVSGTRQGTHAYRLARVDGRWLASESWHNPEVAMYMSTPVLADGLLYGHSAKRKGQFVALDAATGAVRWATEGREGSHASVLLTPGHVVYLTEGADLIVVRRGGESFAVDHRYRVADAATWASPVLLGGDLLVRDATGLVLLTSAPAASPPPAAPGG
jgi:outer membrane protein assembly factor BamB